MSTKKKMLQAVAGAGTNILAGTVEGNQITFDFGNTIQQMDFNSSTGKHSVRITSNTSGSGGIIGLLNEDAETFDWAFELMEGTLVSTTIDVNNNVYFISYLGVAKKYGIGKLAAADGTVNWYKVLDESTDGTWVSLALADLCIAGNDLWIVAGARENSSTSTHGTIHRLNASNGSEYSGRAGYAIAGYYNSSANTYVMGVQGIWNPAYSRETPILYVYDTGQGISTPGTTMLYIDTVNEIKSASRYNFKYRLGPGSIVFPNGIWTRLFQQDSNGQYACITGSARNSSSQYFGWFVVMNNNLSPSTGTTDMTRGFYITKNGSLWNGNGYLVYSNASGLPLYGYAGGTVFRYGSATSTSGTTWARDISNTSIGGMSITNNHEPLLYGRINSGPIAIFKIPADGSVSNTSSVTFTDTTSTTVFTEDKEPFNIVRGTYQGGVNQYGYNNPAFNNATAPTLDEVS